MCIIHCYRPAELPVISGESTTVIDSIEPHSTYEYKYTIQPSIEGSLIGFRAVCEYLKSENDDTPTIAFSTNTHDMTIYSASFLNSVVSRAGWPFTAYIAATTSAILLPALAYIY